MLLADAIKVQRIDGEAGGEGELEVMDLSGEIWQVPIEFREIQGESRLFVVWPEFVNVSFNVTPTVQILNSLTDASVDFLNEEVYWSMTE